MDEKNSTKQDFSKNRVKSSILKAQGKTFFFDVNVAEGDRKYLKITESRFMGEGKDHVRNSVVLFADNVDAFQNSLREISAYLR